VASWRTWHRDEQPANENCAGWCDERDFSYAGLLDPLALLAGDLERCARSWAWWVCAVPRLPPLRRGPPRVVELRVNGTRELPLS